MIDLREAFVDKFNEAKRELRNTGRYESKAYVLHPDGIWTRVRNAGQNASINSCRSRACAMHDRRHDRRNRADPLIASGGNIARVVLPTTRNGVIVCTRFSTALT